MFYFSHEDRIYGVAFLEDTYGQKKAELNELGSRWADSMMYQAAGPLKIIPLKLMWGAKNENWDIDPRHIPSKLENLMDAIKEYGTGE